MFGVLATAKNVAEKSRHVRIDPRAIRQFSQEVARGGFAPPTWDAEHHFHGTDEETIFYLLVLDTVNFCFWPPPGEKKWEISREGRIYSGYYGMAVALKKALESKIPLTDASFLSSLALKQLGDMFAGTGVLQLVGERLRNLEELGRVLLEQYNGRASELVAGAEGSAIRLVERLARDFSSFRDQTTYQGQEVFFYKRAQLFASDLHGALGGKGLGSFSDMKDLTAFADYKLPQVLRHLGVFIYSPELAEKVDRMIQLDPGSAEEVEIRACTVWAVELIRQEMNCLGKEICATEIDGLLWNLGQNDRFRARPYHRTVTTFY
jgi:hypothetical protein